MPELIDRTKVTFEEAKVILSKLVRQELRDHTFGDEEIYWHNKDSNEIIATGYSNGKVTEVCVNNNSFDGKQAEELIKLGQEVNIERNDTTGPDEFKLGELGFVEMQLAPADKQTLTEFYDLKDSILNSFKNKSK